MGGFHPGFWIKYSKTLRRFRLREPFPMRKIQSDRPILVPIKGLCEPVLTFKRSYPCAPAALRRLAETALGWRVRAFFRFAALPGGEIGRPGFLGVPCGSGPPGRERDEA